MSDFDKMSLTGKAFVVLFSSYAMIFVAALWMNHLVSEFFIKLTVTYVIVTVLLAIVYLVRREFLDDEKAKNEKYMD